MKKIWKIVRRVLLTLGLTIYILVALVNFSVVQSYLGALAGSYFSKEWGGKVYIGSLHAMPFDHLIADNLLWISPTGDTLLVADQLKASFRTFPYSNQTLDFNRVYLKNAYYHFAIENHKTNLQFLIDYFKSDKKKEKHAPFTVKVKTLELDNVHYRMDLPDKRKKVYAYGVQIPHMEFLDIHAKFKDVLVVNDDVTCQISHLSTCEKSGFRVDDLSGQIHVNRYNIVAKNLKVETPKSHIYLNATLKYNDWKGIKGYVNTVQHDVDIKPGTQVAMSDVAYWAPVLWGLDATIDAQGTAIGTVDSMTTDLCVRWGSKSSALVAGTVVGLPKINTTYFDVEVERLVTNQEDLKPLLDKLNMKGSVKKILDEVGFVDLVATLQGGMNERVATNIQADCGLGRIKADATLYHTPQGYNVSLDAQSEKVELTFLPNKWIRHTGISLMADGEWQGDLKNMTGWQQRLSMSLDGRVSNSILKGYRLASATFSGELKKGILSASVESSDSLTDLEACLEANLTGEENRYKTTLNIKNLDCGLLPHPLATHLTATAKGNSLDEIDVRLYATGTRYGDMTLDDINLNIVSDAEGKEIVFKSDLADATVKGQFDYKNLPVIVNHLKQRYLPELFNDTRDPDTTMATRLRNEVFSYRIRWNDDGRKLHSLIKNVTIAPGTIIDGTYNYGEQLKLVMVSDSLRIGSVKLENVGISGRPWGKRYEVQADVQSLTIGKMELLERVTARLNSARETSTVELRWGSYDMPTRGDLQLELTGNNITTTKSFFYIGEMPWRLSTEGIIVEKNNDGRLMVKSEKLQLESQDQKIDARMQIGGKESDCVELNFDNFDLHLICDMLLQNSPISVSGDISGHCSLLGLASTPYLTSDLVIDSCLVNKQYLGAVKLNSHWNSEKNNLTLRLTSKQIRAFGWMGLGKKETDLNFKVNFDSLELAMVQPLLSTFSSHIGGELHGNVEISGTLSHPQFVGEAKVENGELKVDITDVTYHFSDSIQFKNNIITLNDFDILDPFDNKATANGTIELTNNNRILLDIGLTTDNFLLLNKKGGENFYGKVLSSVDGKATGYIDDLNITVRARTNPGCDITVPISSQQSVKSKSYITFVGEKTGDEGLTTTNKKKKTNYTLELDLSITPDAKINLPMNFNEVAVTVGGSGTGDLHLNLNNTDKAQMMGNYEISSGTIKVGLLSIYEKKFTIEKGSNLNFQGSVPDARFDVRAVYSQRANLSTLTGSLSSVDNTQKYIQVENIIAISGTLKDPKIGFDLRLPNADQSVEEEVFAYIDRKSERDMLNQTVSLLISGSFYNVNRESSSSSGSALNLVTSIVGNSITDMVQFVDVNIDYRAATEETNQQFDVNISKDWGRWYVESTLGYGGESRDIESSSVNGAIIDALIGYRLSSVLHLYAYNRTNTNDYTRIDLPYKQGVGLKLTKDFDNWGDLFKRKKKKKK